MVLQNFALGGAFVLRVRARAGCRAAPLEAAALTPAMGQKADDRNRQAIRSGLLCFISATKPQWSARLPAVIDICLKLSAAAYGLQAPRQCDIFSALGAFRFRENAHWTTLPQIGTSAVPRHEL